MKHDWLTILIVLVAIDGWAAAPLTIDEAVREALASSPQIHEGEAYRQAAEFTTHATRADFLPRISASYSYQNLTESPYINIAGTPMVIDTRDQHHWEIALHQPIFSGFAISARHRLAQLGLATRKLDLQQARRRVILQVKQGCFDLLIAEKKLDVARGNIDTANTALIQARERWRITDRLYRQQLTTTTEVLDARSYLDRAQSASHEAQYGYGSALARLEWAMGKP